MTKTQKYILYIVSVLVVVLGVYVLIHKSTVNQTIVKSFGATGDTYAQMPLASIGMNVATVTPASLYNGSGRDRIVTRMFISTQTNNVYGTTTLYDIQVATSSNAYNLNSNTNYLADWNGYALSASTTAGYIHIASTTPSFNNVGTQSVTFPGASLSQQVMVWPNGTYLNATISSSTDRQWGGVGKAFSFSGAIGGALNNNSSLGSTTSGFFGVEYYPQ